MSPSTNHASTYTASVAGIASVDGVGLKVILLLALSSPYVDA